MQKKSAIFLWLISVGTVVGMEAAPDASPAPIRHQGEQVASISSFLVKACDAGAAVKGDAARLLRDARAKAAGTLRRISPEKRERKGLPHPESAPAKKKKWPRSKTGHRPVTAGDLPSVIPSVFPEELKREFEEIAPPQPQPRRSQSHYEELSNLPGASPYSPWDAPGITAAFQEELTQRLSEALDRRDIEAAKKLIREGANPNTQNQDGNTLLHFAAGKGDDETTAWLVEQVGAHIDIKNRLEWTPLEVAQSLGMGGTTAFLTQIQAQAVGDFKTRYQDTFATMKKAAARRSSPPKGGKLSEELCAALRAHDQKTATQLIMDGAHPNTQDPFSGNTLLHIAAAQEKYGLVAQLFQAGYRPNPNIRNNRGETVLHIVAHGKTSKISAAATVSFLKNEHGRTPADVHATDASRKTPLECATQEGKRRMVRTLLKRCTGPEDPAVSKAQELCPHERMKQVFEKYKARIGNAPLPETSSSSAEDDEIIYARMPDFQEF